MVEKYKAIIMENRKQTPNVHTLVLRPDKEIDFKPGQYIMVDIPQDDKILKRAYSICSSPLKKNEIELCIKKIKDGRASNYLCKLEEESSLNIMGPIGIFTLNKENSFVFLASGTGIAPLRSMILYLLESKTNKKIILFYGMREEQDIVFRNEFEELSKKHENFTFVPVLSRQTWHGEQGHVQDVCGKYIKNMKNAGFYICGLQNMVDNTVKFLKDKGFPDKQIHYEKYN